MPPDTRKRRHTDEDESPSSRSKRVKPPPRVSSTEGQTSSAKRNLTTYTGQPSLRKALENVPDCSLYARDCVKAWVTTDQPGYSSAMPTSSKDSQEYRRRSKASKASYGSDYRAPTEATEAETVSSIKTIHNPRARNILADNGISFEHSPSERAQNHQEIRRRLEQPRGSLSPSQGYQLEDEYEQFVDAHETAPNEDTLISTAFMPHFHRGLKPCGLNSSFTALAPLTEEQLPPPKPDIYCGEPYKSLHPEARKACERVIVPYARTPYVLINQTTELKGIDGKPDVARTQVMCNGAAGARAMDSLRYFANPHTDTLDLKARTHGAVFANGCLSVYATHSKPSQSGRERDYVVQLVAGEMATASPQQFRRAQTLYRNSCDISQKHREAAIADANDRCHASLPISPAQSQSQLSTKRPRADSSSRSVRADIQHSHADWLQRAMDRLRAAGYSESQAQDWIRTALLPTNSDDASDDSVDASHA